MSEPLAQRRRGERGMTLIEIIATIGLLTLGVLGLTAGIASTERIAAINQDQAKLEVAMRQISDFVRDSSTKGLTYKDCAKNDGSDYPRSQLPTPPTGVDWLITNVYQSVASGDARNGSSAGVTPTSLGINDGICSTSWDFGVQEIRVKVCDFSCATSTNRSLARTVWKSKSW